MPTIADFRVIDAGEYQFLGVYPNPFSPPEVIEYAFNALAVDTATKSVLLLRLHPEGGTDCKLEMYLNGTFIFGRTLTPGIERSMHVAIPSEILTANDNSFTMSKVEGDTALTVSELILFFQAAIA